MPLRKTYRVKLIAGMLFSEDDVFLEAERALSERFGDVDYRSPLMPFEWTDHYTEEMGPGLKRRFISFKGLIYPDELADAKAAAMEAEKRFSSPPGGRRINIDPGYVEGAKLVLATTKNYDHRICLRNGIYAEVTLHYRGRSFIPWEWTYPDYRSREYIDIFNHIRKIYLESEC